MYFLKRKPAQRFNTGFTSLILDTSEQLQRTQTSIRKIAFQTVYE